MDRFKGKTAGPSTFTTETPMEHSIALVTGTTSGLGMRQPALLPERAGARSSSPGAAWLGPKKRPLSSRLRPKCRSSRRWS